jgi:hypothetical protein
MKNKVKSAIKLLDGKKTHIVAALTVIYGLYEAFVASGGTWHTLMPWLLSGAGLAALRVAVAKLEAN